MIAVDTNILVYGHREEMPEHGRAKDHLTQLAEGASPWGLPIFCLGEFLRVVTHPRLFTPPSTIQQALAFVDALMESPTLRILGVDESYWGLLRARVSDARATGNLVFDAQIAAVCVAYGATLLTADRDFARFGIPTAKFD